MKCPKCGFFGLDHLDTCKKCGNDVSAERKKLGLTRLRRPTAQSQAVAQEESPPAETLREETPEPVLRAVTPKPTPPIPRFKEPEAMAQKGLRLLEKTVALRPEQLKKPFEETEEETFQFGAEAEDFPSAPLEKTINMKDLQQDARPGRDDFEFPDLRESKPPLDTVSGESDDLSSTLAMPGIPEIESASIRSSPADDESEDFSGDSTLVDSTISLGDEDVSMQTGAMPHSASGQKEETGTMLLRPEEVEDILQSEISSLEASRGGPAGDRSKTELLGEDQLSKVLDELDTDYTKEENNP